MLTVIIDYDSGNLHSASKAFERMAQETNAGEVRVSADPATVAKADRLVLPGDGAFPACRKALVESDVFEAMIESVLERGRPFLGICVGMQMMAQKGFEYEATSGLGWIDGDIHKIKPNEPALKIPHMGWNNLSFDRPHPLLRNVPDGSHAYFVHSYHMELNAPSQRIACVDYGQPISAIVGRDTMVGTQFHPEKSSSAGLQMIANFLSWSP